MHLIFLLQKVLRCIFFFLLSRHLTTIDYSSCVHIGFLYAVVSNKSTAGAVPKHASFMHNQLLAFKFNFEGSTDLTNNI